MTPEARALGLRLAVFLGDRAYWPAPRCPHGHDNPREGFGSTDTAGMPCLECRRPMGRGDLKDFSQWHVLLAPLEAYCDARGLGYAVQRDPPWSLMAQRGTPYRATMAGKWHYAATAAVALASAWGAALESS